jgi:hypothetical protein
MELSSNNRTKPLYPTLAILLAVLASVAAIEFAMGRLPLGPDHKFGLWESDIWSSENSQRFADPYSFSHIVHGILLYAILHQLTGRLKKSPWWQARKDHPHPEDDSRPKDLPALRDSAVKIPHSALRFLINAPSSSPSPSRPPGNSSKTPLSSSTATAPSPSPLATPATASSTPAAIFL